MAEALDLQALDRDVARTAARVARIDAETAAGAKATETVDPFEERRHVAGRSTFMSLDDSERSPATSLDAPLRHGLRRWVYAFTLERIARQKSLELHDARDEAVAIVLRPVSRKISWNEAWRGALEATTTDDVTLSLQAAADAAAVVASPAREVRALRREAAHRLGVDDRAAFATGVPAEVLTSFARALFDATDAIAIHARAAETKRREGRSESAADFLALALGRSAVEGWPAKLSRRWLEELAPALVRGLSLDVGTLPDALGTASFARALFAYGRAVRVAGPSPSLPFALARDPFPTDAERFGNAFGALVASAPFHRRVLGTGQDVATQQARVGAGVLLAAARLTAARWLAAEDSGADREELGHRLLGGHPPDALFEAFPLARPDDAARLLALGTTLPFARELVDRHDEDWFANPRALADLRARAAAPAHVEETAWTRDAADAADANGGQRAIVVAAAAVTAAKELASVFESALA